MSAPSTGLHEEEALGKAYDGRLMRRLLAYARPYVGLVAASLGFLAVEGLLQLVGPLLTRRVIDVALPAGDIAAAMRLAGIFAAALVASFLVSYAETMLTSLLGQRVMRDLRHQLFAHFQRLPVTFFDRNPVGRLITRVTSDVESLNELFTAGVVSGLGDLFTLCAIMVMMLIVDWRLALAAFAVIPFVVLTSSLFQRRVRSAYRDIRTRLARINAFLQERISGMRVVQLFGQERAESARFEVLNDDHLRAHMRSIRIYAVYFPVIEVLTTIALASVIVGGARRVATTGLTIGTVAAFLQLVRRFFDPLQDLADKYNMLQQAMAASERIFTLLDTPPASGTALDDDVPAARASTGAGVTVEFHDVWFAYDIAHVAEHGARAGAIAGTREERSGMARAEREPEWVLRGVSFRAPPGATVAIVGHTGAGKSTIVNLLLRFYEPQRGRITIDGVDIRALPLDALRTLIGYVQQDIFLFAGDVASNIRLSSSLSDDEVARSATRVGADRIIRRLPGGYAHRLGERGASVSVGERQLLAFARAIAADPSLLILDEATSAVDSEIEADIQRALDVLMSGRTTIAIAHRLSTIVNAAEILVLHHGHVHERGTHRQLIAKGGLYARLYRLQAGAREGSAIPSDAARMGA